MAGTGGGRVAMEEGYSAEELEVARILVMLTRLVWKADHEPPCTHNFRWGARKRRSAGRDDPPDPPQPAAAPPRLPPPSLPARPPPAAEKLSKKRSREGAAAAAPAPSRKDASPGALQPPAAATAEAAEEAAAAMGTSSPETPLDFCSSAEEAGAEARAQACPPNAGRPAAKKPKLKHDHLSKQVDQFKRTRTELEKEAAEIRKRLEALRERNSGLVELRNKLEKEEELHRRQKGTDQCLLHGRGCLDLLPTGPAPPVDAAGAPDVVQPQLQQPQQYQHAWPQHWGSNHVLLHQVASGFPIHPSPDAAGSQRWSWAGTQAWRLDGNGAASYAGRVPHLNSNAGVEFALGSQQYPQQQQQQGDYYYQQVEQWKRTPEEQRAARKKRIEMIQKRRNAAGAAADGVSVKKSLVLDDKDGNSNGCSLGRPFSRFCSFID